MNSKNQNVFIMVCQNLGMYLDKVSIKYPTFF